MFYASCGMCKLCVEIGSELNGIHLCLRWFFFFCVCIRKTGNRAYSNSNAMISFHSFLFSFSTVTIQRLRFVVFAILETVVALLCMVCVWNYRLFIQLRVLVVICSSIFPYFFSFIIWCIEICRKWVEVEVDVGLYALLTSSFTDED